MKYPFNYCVENGTTCEVFRFYICQFSVMARLLYVLTLCKSCTSLYINHTVLSTDFAHLLEGL